MTEPNFTVFLLFAATFRLFAYETCVTDGKRITSFRRQATRVQPACWVVAPARVQVIADKLNLSLVTVSRTWKGFMALMPKRLHAS